MDYSRLEQLSWFSAEKVQSATAVVVGAGALGNEVVKNFALLGWGKLYLVDFDQIESSNLTRSVLFREGDIGRSKVDTMADAISALNPDCEIVPLERDVRDVLTVGLALRSDVLIGCLDNLAARLFMNQVAALSGTPLVDAGLSEWEGVIQTFEPRTGPCYACGLTEADLADAGRMLSCPAFAQFVERQGGVPTTPILASITGAWAVQEALRRLNASDGKMSTGEPWAGREVRFNLHSNRLVSSKLTRPRDCLRHSLEVDVSEAVAINGRASWEESLARLEAEFRCDVRLHFWRSVRLISCTNDHCSMIQATVQSERPTEPEQPSPCTRCGKQTDLRLVNGIHRKDDWIGTRPAEAGWPEGDLVTVVLADAMERHAVVEGIGI